jgi:hypothetical protein
LRDLRNKKKRLYVKIIPLMAIAFIGASAIQAIIVSVFLNTYVSLNWLKANMNLSIDLPKAYGELSQMTLAASVWLVIVHLAVIWYVGEKLERRLAKKWPDEPALKVRLTKKKSI